ncbi:hypothetical protein [Aquimarina sp. 2201CG14-23]|uniref:hypothetical protein n=1 Tax=Aquimarina mycalae TaxID=3040073 RepID=UPI002477DAB0|nr:hypothetical protein [Aquimarina sp. 2201CG14-23]MDH7447045.1 hypothetical protein [Aquimarina sp. 2201CG14-23]
MNTHNDFNDLEFEKRFKDCSLNPSLFTHEAHLRLAWIYITSYDLEVACDMITNQILAYVVSLGETDKFNKTLTVAAIKIVNHFIQKSTSTSFQNFIIEFPELNYNFKQLINSHYSFDIFNSEKAKKTFLEPDLLVFS